LFSAWSDDDCKYKHNDNTSNNKYNSNDNCYNDNNVDDIRFIVYWVFHFTACSKNDSCILFMKVSELSPTSGIIEASNDKVYSITSRTLLIVFVYVFFLFAKFRQLQVQVQRQQRKQQLQLLLQRRRLQQQYLWQQVSQSVSQ